MKRLLKYSAAALVCTLPAFILSGCGGKPKKKENPVAVDTASVEKGDFQDWKENTEIRAAIEEQRFAAARDGINNRLQENPRDARAHFLLGQCYLGEKNFNKARRSLETAIDLAPDNRTYSRELGRCHVEIGEDLLGKNMPSEAAQNFKKAIELDYQPVQTEQKLADAFSSSAQSLIDLGNSDDAENLLREALQLLPDRPSLRVRLAQLLIDGDRLMEAERVLKTLCETNPEYEHGLTAYAKLLYRMGEVKTAANYVSQALAIAPVDAEALRLKDMLQNNIPIITPPVPEQVTPETAREMLLELEKSQQYSQQKKILTTMLSQFPSEAWAHLKLSEINEKLELYEQAMTDVKTFLQAEPNSDQGNFQLARMLQQQGNLEEALNLLNKLHETFADKEALLNEMGQVYAKMGRFDEAKKAWNQVLSADPENAGAIFSLGQLQMETGDNTGAQSYFERAVRLDPENAKFRYFAGINLIQSGLKDQAHAFWSASKNYLNSEDPYARRINNVLGDAPQVMNPVETNLPVVHIPTSVIEEAPEDIDYQKSLEYARNGYFAEAINGFRTVLSRDPANFNALMNLGKVYSISGDSAQACALYLKALKLSPQNIHALKALANAYSEIGMHRFAAEITSQAIASHPGQTEGFPSYKASPSAIKNSPRAFKPLISAFLNESLTQEAQAIVQAGIEEQSQSAEMLLLQGEVYKELGQYESALESYRKALELEPQSPDPYVKTGDLLIAAGQFTNAAAEYDKALKTGFIDPDTMFIIVDRYKQLGREAEAQRVLGRLKGMNLNQSQIVKLETHLGSQIITKENNQ